MNNNNWNPRRYKSPLLKTLGERESVPERRGCSSTPRKRIAAAERARPQQPDRTRRDGTGRERRGGTRKGGGTRNHGGTRPGIPQPRAGPAAGAGEAYLGVGGRRQPELGSAPRPSRSPVGEGRARAAPSEGAAEALFSRFANTQRCLRSCRRGSGSLVAARNVLGTPRRTAPAAPGGFLSLCPSRGRRAALPDRPRSGRTEKRMARSGAPGALPAPGRALAPIPAHTGGGWRGRGGSVRRTHARDSNYLLPHKMFLLSTTAHTSALLPASLNSNTKPAHNPFSRRCSRAHNRLSGAGASGGGLEVPPGGERSAELPGPPLGPARPKADSRAGCVASSTGKRPSQRQPRCPFPCTPLSKRLSNQFAARNMLIANGAH